ncbi:MAG: YbhB/YbcL family Raf kinase inhibitor-like protein [Chloroflexi bacterium]|nr:YbhB/YbcL family Raf kinase inhibitor-like protein [Chloroflexota bacterium]
MTDATLTLTSDVFAEGEAIPPRFSCDGEDLSPPLAWAGVPEGTAGYALLVDDPDARGFVHWVVADVPSDAAGLPEGSAGGGTEGRNDFGRSGYGGPCPPSGTHRYAFTLVALSSPTGLGPGFTADELRDAIGDRTLASTTLTGTYTRGGS